MFTKFIICIVASCMGVFASMSVLPVSVQAAGPNFAFGSIDEVDSSDDLNIGSLGDDNLLDDKPLIDVIKSITNRVLGILAFIALIILLAGGLLMVTAAGDEGRYEKGFKYLRYAAGGLVLIGLARFVISLGFWLTRTLAEGSAGSTANTLH